MPTNRSILSNIPTCVFLAAFMVAPALGTPIAQEAQVAPAPAQWTVVDDNWYEMEMAGAKAGWMRTLLEQSQDQFRQQTQTRIKMNRGAVAVEMQMSFTIIETKDGRPVSVEAETKMGRQTERSRLDFKEDHLLHTSKIGGRDVTRREELPEGQWMPPIAAERFAKQQRADGVTEFSYRVMDPQTGQQPVTITTERTGEKQIEHEGKPVQVTLWRTKNDLINMEVQEQYLPDGRLFMTQLTGGLTVVQRLSTKEKAQGEGNEPAPELLVSSFVKPDRKIERPMKATAATLRLRMKEGSVPELPSAGAQRVQADPDNPATALLAIDIRNNQPATSQERDDRRYLEPSAMIDSSDALVMALANQAVRQAPQDADAFAKADAIRRHVYKSMSQKGMDTAFATASETAKTKTGDCSEHAVLLCAMLRAQNIPARVASGLVYADSLAPDKGAFAWHMWTQALIDDKWVDFDATLGPNVRYNAAHVLTGVSSLADGLGAQDMSVIFQLIGNIEIDVVDVSYEK